MESKIQTIPANTEITRFKHIIVDQGQAEIAGYTNREDRFI